MHYESDKEVKSPGQKDHIGQANSISSRTLGLSCSICLCQYPLNYQNNQSGFYTINQTCQHYFCKSCIIQHIQYCLDNNVVVKCPQENCSELFITHQSTIFQLLTPNYQHKFNKQKSVRELYHQSDKKICRNQECLGTFYIPISNQQPNTLFQCNTCSTLHCPKCFQIKHKGVCLTTVAKILEKNMKYKQCKQCKNVIERVEGCTHITCICGHFFCYKCGQTLQIPHKCKSPEDITCLNKVRWQMEYQQEWYESGKISFLHLLLTFTPRSDRSLLFKMMAVVCYSLLICPLSVMLAIVTVLTFYSVMVTLYLLFMIFLPYIIIINFQPGLNNTMGDYPNGKIVQKCGKLVAFIIVTVFFPIFCLINLIQLVFTKICGQFINETKETFIFFAKVLFLVRNLFLMPCLILTNIDQYDPDVVQYHQTQNIHANTTESLEDKMDSLQKNSQENIHQQHKHTHMTRVIEEQ